MSERSGRSVGNKFFGDKIFFPLYAPRSYLTSHIHTEPVYGTFVLETNAFGAGDEHIRRQGRAHLALEANAFGAGNKLILALETNEANVFRAGDEITRLALKTKHV